MDPAKCSYFIDGCGCSFVPVDGIAYATQVARDSNGEEILDERGIVVLLPAKHHGSSLLGDWGDGVTSPRQQRIQLWIPEELFDPDMQYVCVKQCEDTGLEIVAEEDIKPGDTAVRILLPYDYFRNKLACYHFYDPDSTATLFDCQGVEVDLIIGAGLYVACY